MTNFLKTFTLVGVLALTLTACSGVSPTRSDTDTTGSWSEIHNSEGVLSPSSDTPMPLGIPADGKNVSGVWR